MLTHGLIPVWSLSLLLIAGCAPNSLRSLVLDGPELHPSLVTRSRQDAATLVLTDVLRDNPYLSTDAEFVDVMGRISSQGRLNGVGVRAALYALYMGESDVGIYGLETASAADADRIESTVRGIWAHNGRLGLARVHRKGLVLVVVWNNGVSPACWEAINTEVVKRLALPDRAATRRDSE